MGLLAHFFRLLLLLLLLEGAGVPAFAQTAPQTASGRQTDLRAVFHPANGVQNLKAVCEKVLIVCQLLAVLVVVGGLAGRMRLDEAPFASVAGAVLGVGFIASLSWLSPKVMETADSLTALVGERAIPGAKLQLSAGETPPNELSVLQQKLGELEKQWTLSSSPFLDSLDEQREFSPGSEESWLALGWNWARRPPSPTETPSAWESAAAAERGGLLLRITLGIGSLVHFSETGCYLAEIARLVVFHAGFALLPLFIAGLGVDSLRTPAFRAIVALAGVAFWPVAWAVAHAATLAMLGPALELHRKCASAAMYPKVADDASRTVAMAAPYLSWSLLGFLAVVTAALCLWLLFSLFFGPWLLHKALGAGAGKIVSSRA